MHSNGRHYLAKQVCNPHPCSPLLSFQFQRTFHSIHTCSMGIWEKLDSGQANQAYLLQSKLKNEQKLLLSPTMQVQLDLFLSEYGVSSKLKFFRHKGKMLVHLKQLILVNFPIAMYPSYYIEMQSNKCILNPTGDLFLHIVHTPHTYPLKKK